MKYTNFIKDTNSNLKNIKKQSKLSNLTIQHIFFLILIGLIFTNYNTSNASTGAVYKTIELPQKNSIMFVKEIDQKLYVGTRGGLYIQNLKSQKWETIDFKDKYPTCIANNDKLIVIGTNKGILISEYQEDTKDNQANNQANNQKANSKTNYNKFVGVEVEFENTMINDIYADNEAVYFATNIGVFGSDANIDSVENLTGTMQVKSIQAVTPYNNRLVIGSSDGLFDTNLEKISWRIFKQYMLDVKSIFVNDTSFYVSNNTAFKMCDTYTQELKDNKITTNLGEVFKVTAKGNNVLALARGGVHISIDNGKNWKSIAISEMNFKAGFVGDKFYFGSFLGNLYYLDPKDYEKL